MNNNDFIDDNNSSGDTRGKFSDRLKKIRRDKNRKNNKNNDKKESIFKRFGRNILKIILALPMVIYSVVNSDNKKNIKNSKGNNLILDEVVLSKEQEQLELRRIKVNKIREMNVSSLRKKKEIELNKKKEIEKKNVNCGFLNSSYSNENKRDNLTEKVKDFNDKNNKIVILQKEIIDLIKKKLVKNINELEILYSELYMLKMVSGDEVFLKDCQEKIKEIKKLLSRINTLKDKYDYLKDTYDFDYMFQHGDEVLVDKILELKNLCSNEDIKYVIDNYKILDEYKYLYLKIDKLQEDTYKYEEYKKNKELELRDRDIDFDLLTKQSYKVDKEKELYDVFVKEQELLLKQLDEKLHKIDSYERVSYKLKGFNKLVANSFKFLGLVLLNPLKGFIPGIAVQTAATKNVIHNLYNNLEWEQNSKMVYETIDYSNIINVARNDLNSTLLLLNNTLDDVAKLKNKYKVEFSKYQDSIPGYKDTMKKLNKMENAMLGNKVKVEIMQERMRIKERENENKMKMVKKLNSSNNNNKIA